MWASRSAPESTIDGSDGRRGGSYPKRQHAEEGKGSKKGEARFSRGALGETPRGTQKDARALKAALEIDRSFTSSL